MNTEVTKHGKQTKQCHDHWQQTDHLRRIIHEKLTPNTIQIWLCPIVFHEDRQSCIMAILSDRKLCVGLWSIHRFVHRSCRYHSRWCISNHLYPCTVGRTIPFAIYRNSNRVHTWSNVAPENGFAICICLCVPWSRSHHTNDYNRHDLGKAYVGNMVGMGCSSYQWAGIGHVILRISHCEIEHQANKTCPRSIDIHSMDRLNEYSHRALFSAVVVYTTPGTKRTTICQTKDAMDHAIPTNHQWAGLQPAMFCDHHAFSQSSLVRQGSWIKAFVVVAR